GSETRQRRFWVCSTTLPGFVPVLTLYRLFGWCELWWRWFWLFPQSIPNQIVIRRGRGGFSAGFIMPALRPQGAKTEKLANLNHCLERLHLNELVAHAGILAPLLDCLGAGAPPDGTLLATKKSQSVQEKFFQLSQTKSVVIQLLMQAGRGGIGF